MSDALEDAAVSAWIEVHLSEAIRKLDLAKQAPTVPEAITQILAALAILAELEDFLEI